MVTVERGTRTARRGVVTLTPVDQALAPVSVQMIGAAVHDGRQPRWGELERPRRQNVLEWQGYDVQRQKLTVMFCGDLDIDTGELSDITSETVALANLACPGSAKPPPVLRISGPLYGIGVSDRWVLESYEPGEPQRRVSDGRVSKVEYQLTLAQWLSTDVLTSVVATSPAAKATASIGAPAAPNRTYTVARGDTLSKIAARQLGSAGRWPDIASLNGIRDPNRVTVGQVLKLP